VAASQTDLNGVLTCVNASQTGAERELLSAVPNQQEGDRADFNNPFVAGHLVAQVLAHAQGVVNHDDPGHRPSPDGLAG
jgi:hypothetical protein